MTNLKVIGVQHLGHFEFTGIEGGFGEGKRAMTVKDIAAIHGKEVKYINKQINTNRRRFINGVDLIDCLSSSDELRERFIDGVDLTDFKTGSSNELVLAQLFSKAEIGNANNLFILSERGYSKLLKILEDETAWEIYDQLVDGYFAMREEINKKLPTDPMEILRLVFDANDNTNEKVGQLDSRIVELEKNKPLSPSDYGYINRLVSQRVNNVIKERHLEPTKEQRSQLYQDINSEIKKIARVPNRMQLRDRHYDMVIDFIVNWQPSTATMTLINQMENEEGLN
ncbi:hypothetical protein EP56_15170 [Listeriaceae bacterium FSL A5-0209]|nr:hypothetical protein EP56_15170 [Listeriaceae bacterium FSL A5-0209]